MNKAILMHSKYKITELWNQQTKRELVKATEKIKTTLLFLADLIRHKHYVVLLNHFGRESVRLDRNRPTKVGGTWSSLMGGAKTYDELNTMDIKISCWLYQQGPEFRS